MLGVGMAGILRECHESVMKILWFRAFAVAKDPEPTGLEPEK